MSGRICFSVMVGLFIFQCTLANTYYVTTAGSDSTGDGSFSNPWQTIRHAVANLPPGGEHTIRVSQGTYIENGQIEVPAGVSIEGAGIELTVICAAASFYYHPEVPGFSTDKFLMSLDSPTPSEGNQSLKGFTIDGDLKQLHGGIYVRYRNNVVIDHVRVRNTNFNGIWLWDVKDSQILHSELLNCSWGSTAYSAGALQLGNIEDLSISNLSVDENMGYGIKTIGPDSVNNIIGLSINDSRVSVNPHGLWNGGSAPNIAIELFQDNIVGCVITNCYVDNTISVVTTNPAPPTGTQTIRIHHNTLDMDTGANGAGYGIELTVHDAEVDHNYFLKGSYGIANWHGPMQNWSIHHNIFYALGYIYPGDILRSEFAGLHNVNFFNNTVEFTGDRTMNVIGLYGGVSEKLNIFNNLLIDNNNGYSYYPNSLIHLENNAQLSELKVANNLFHKLPVGAINGTYSNNLKGNPKILESGDRPSPYYTPATNSPLLDAGLAPSAELPALTDDIGAYEYDERTFSATGRTATSESTISPLPDVETSKGMVIYPNPAKNDFTITYESPIAEHAEVRVATITSTIVERMAIPLQAGQNVIKLSSDRLSNGIYFISLVTSTGKYFTIKTAISK